MDQERKWGKSLLLGSATSNGEPVTVPYTLDFVYLNSLVEEAKQNVWLADLSPKMNLSSDVHTVATTDAGQVDDTFEQSINVALGASELQWEGDFEKLDQRSFMETVTVTNSGY